MTQYNWFQDNPKWMDQYQLDGRVIQAMQTVPRHEFVPKNDQPLAYENHPLPIGYGQTISQPLIVAFMTSQLTLKPSHTVLEIGTGSGYQTAILATLVKQVYSIEIIPALHKSAKARLLSLGYHNTILKLADGQAGWLEHAPFDAIMVTATAKDVPSALIQQLKNAGKMILPVGKPMGMQHLVLVSKNDAGKVSSQSLLPVRFVPLTGQTTEN